MALLNHFSSVNTRGLPSSRPLATGRLTRTVGLTYEAKGINVPVGSQCRIKVDSLTSIVAEVVGFENGKTYLMPLSRVNQISAGAQVIPIASDDHLSVGGHLLGRVIDGAMKPIDGLSAFSMHQSERIPFSPPSINPMRRKPIHEPLDTGIRAINALLTVGCGQRIGLFAGSGVGKSVLLGMMTRFTNADVIVVGLIGERGREVKEFIDQNIGPQGLAKSIVVAAPIDESPVMRLRAGMTATRIAEYYRDKGQRVLLLFDSLTRYAQAQREVGLASGEMPVSKGYPPSVFSKLPLLVERAGNGAQDRTGSITAFYTVLTEGDDLQDPVADSARSILDGHIVLSRRLAEEGIYPAIDIETSISRVMPSVVSSAQLSAAQRVKQWLSRYQQNRDLISVGAYTKGVDPITDTAIEKRDAILGLVSQQMNEAHNHASSLAQLLALVESDSVEEQAHDVNDSAGPTVHSL